MGRTAEMEKIAESAAAHYDGENGFGNSGRTNFYTCEDTSFNRRGGGCKRLVVTVDREPGVTPFLTKCDACGGLMKSGFYRPGPKEIPTHEWYRPDDLADVDSGSRDHVKNGGLLLREIAHQPEQSNV